ncbi:unnamed protein product [Nezara viridula]|uniref:Sushi domain-containing protein n=1 Tax=Nezara viridula TaxID=85310 RepID=A0A9P0HEU3_NEZVI|nr:unnamed protein product [Nezara viridula]
MLASNQFHTSKMRALLLVVSLHVSHVFCDLRERRAVGCTGPSFRCSNGECISSTSVCDGAVDCRDRSDETQAVCTELNLPCPSFAFRCAYGACVDKSTICNGIQDCADNSDELLPQCVKSNPIAKKCKQYEFQCDSGQCVDEVSVCDGTSDCVDESDETITQCINIRCPAYTFQCAYGGCIDKIKKCDGKEDCKDGSDEDTELCKASKPRQNSTTTVRPTPPRRKKPTDFRGGCPLPEQPENGSYEVTGCNEADFSSKCRKVPDTIVSSDSSLKYSCNPGYVLPENTYRIFCSEGTWEPTPPRCLKLCKGLHSDSLDLECYYRGSKIDCGQPMRPGTELKATCKQTYHIGDPSTSFTITQCLADGTWANELYKCVPGNPQPPAYPIVYHIYNVYVVNLASDKQFTSADFIKVFTDKSKRIDFLKFFINKTEDIDFSKSFINKTEGTDISKSFTDRNEYMVINNVNVE